MQTKISICIPTYNRAKQLVNCLNSIALQWKEGGAGVQICVSDNGSTDETEEVVRAAQRRFPIKYSRNERNLGIPRNFLKVVAMADGEFAWLLGDDDLLMPDALQALTVMLAEHPEADFFYVNSYHLTTQYVFSYPQPFDTVNLPNDMRPFSNRQGSGELMFLDLVDPKVSFDFLGGMFLAVFRCAAWLENVHALNPDAVADGRTFSHFDNTFPHIKIFARAFAKSKAYFSARPLSVCLTGAREWAPMYPLVASVRLVEALQEYRRNGLPLTRYMRCKNAALHNFIPDLGYMMLHPDVSGFAYVHPLRLIMGSLVYPNFYWSFVRFLIRKSGLMLKKFLSAGMPRSSQS